MRRNLRRTIAFAAAVFLLAGGVSAGAEEAGDGAAAFSGYLFRLKEDAPATVSLMAEDGESGISAVMPEEGVYRAEDMETLAGYVPLDWVEYIEPDYHVELYATPDDPYYAGKTGAESQWYLDRIGMPYAWERELDGSGVRVAVLDSGIYDAHEDLENSNVVPTRNFYTPDDRVPNVDVNDVSDVQGHGTFVSGILDAETGNGKHIAGIAPGAQVFMLKCFAKWIDPNTGRDRVTAKISDLNVAIQAAVDEFKCQVINMSFGIYEEDIDPATEGELLPTLKIAVDYAVEKGVILVAAMGNDYSDPGKQGWHSYPACFDNVVGVGATNYSDMMYSGSQQNENVWVVAPGQQMTSLWRGSPTSIYTYGQGTSYATPCVAGIAALVKSVDPSVDADQFMALLKETANDMGDPGWDKAYGYGMVNIPSLFQRLGKEMTVAGATQENGVVRVTADYYGLPFGTDVVVSAAGYLENGRMVALETMEVTVGAWRTGISLELPLSVPVDEVRVFLSDPETHSPLGGKLTVQVE